MIIEARLTFSQAYHSGATESLLIFFTPSFIGRQN